VIYWLARVWSNPNARYFEKGMNRRYATTTTPKMIRLIDINKCKRVLVNTLL